MTRMFARTTADGTACAETALCMTHASDTRFRAPADTSGRHDAASEPYIEVTANDEVACQVCGAH